MTQPPDSSPQPGEEQDPNKTTVFRPGDSGFAAPPPFGGSDAPIPPPPGQPAYTPPPPPPPPAAQPSYSPPPPPQPSYSPPQPPAYGQQPQYGQQQPGYGQPGYGQPGYAPQVSPYNQGAAPKRAFGVVGGVLTLIGAASVVIAFTAVKWLDGSGPSKFNDIKKIFDGDTHDQAAFLPKAYFQWLGWVLLAVAVVLALLAAAPTGVSPAARFIGTIVGLGATGATFWALDLFQGLPGNKSYSEYLKHASIGFYLAAAGFLVIAIGAFVGPRKT